MTTHDRWQRALAVAFTLAATTLMVAGWLWTVGRGAAAWPGPACHWRAEPGVRLMTAGVLALACLPAARVFLVLVALARRRRWAEVAVAVLVLAELAASGLLAR